MIKTARQLKDLIRNLSKKNAADAQILMRNYMMERFLERISLSSYRDKFILKGGMLVAAMVGLDARSTMDLDATVKGANVSVEDVENMMAEIIAVPIDDGVTFQVKNISEIMDEAEYPGIRVTMTTLFDGVRTPSKSVVIVTRMPGYSASSMISEMFFTWKVTPSSMGTAMISAIMFSTSSTLTLAPLTVASRSIVERASRPTIAATSIPPLRINLSR